MARETCVEILVKVPLAAEVTLPTAIGTAQARALELGAPADQEVTAVALIADGRRLEIGDSKLVEWGIRP